MDDEILQRLQRVVYALPRDQQLDAMTWIEAALTSQDELRGALLELLVSGQAEILRVVDGEPRFRLTATGNDDVLNLLSESPEARAMIERLSGQAFVPPPKGKQ